MKQPVPVFTGFISFFWKEKQQYSRGSEEEAGMNSYIRKEKEE
jgi:hypothetical protein